MEGLGGLCPRKACWEYVDWFIPNVTLSLFSNLFRFYWGEMSWLRLGEPPYCCYAWNRGGGLSKGNPLLKVLNVPKIGKWLDMLIVTYLSGPRAILYTKIRGNFIQTWIIWWQTELSTSCSGWCWNIYLTEWLVATLYEKAPEVKMWLYYLLFVKIWFETIPCYDKNRTPKRYTSLYDNKRLCQLKSIE